ncbi:MAG: 50S ribosomal protein L11 methyltransferase [Ignavibacteria bacterium]|nr:50S ribosomal protein L11 methyltransferase [Ignavibacteria bacterium]MBI3766270.1 50S ribosomal protein L11 methyltransferase [Ignavibacteriales bacterium]
MKTFLEISVSATEQQRELLIPTMIELGCEGFQETDSSLLCYVDKSRWKDDNYQLFKDNVKRMLLKISVNAAVQFREIKEKNWNEEWEKTIQPIEIGDRIVIKPSWCEYDNRGNRIVVQIDPKMSFGTGFHETTRLTLRLLEKWLKQGWTVLDVGTGTGVLAITAVKLGARSAFGIDIDEWSVTNAHENVLANQVVDRVTISDRTIDTCDSSTIDLITANLTLNTNIDLLSEFSRALKPDGYLILSGLLRTDRDSMIQHLIEKRFHIIDELCENEWIAIAAHKLR